MMNIQGTLNGFEVSVSSDTGAVPPALLTPINAASVAPGTCICVSNSCSE
jgi:hypothetical protein